MKKLISLLGLLIILVILLVGAKSCINRSGNRTKIGSSTNYNTFMINAPLNLTAMTIFQDGIYLSWADNSNNEDGFEIERSVGENTFWVQIATVPVDTASFLDADVISGNLYYYRLRAFNTIGDRSEYSNEAGAIASQPLWTAIAAGDGHTIAKTTDNLLWSWGNNSNGQLGLGDTINYSLPNVISVETDWNIIACGFLTTFSIKTDGILWAWGANAVGQLGMGDTGLDNWWPFQVNLDSDWLMAASGYGHSLGLKTDKNLMAWGGNAAGALGFGDTILRVTPTQLGTNSDWLVIDAGASYSSGVKTDNTLWSWGDNYYGQLGLGDSGIKRLTPTQIGIDSDWTTISCKNDYAIGKKTNGILWSWGNNNYGQLGLGDSELRNTPTQIDSNTDWSLVSTGFLHSMAIKTNTVGASGTLWTWGYNNTGGLGIGDTNDRWTPTQIGIDSGWSIIASGNSSSFAIKSDNTLWVWGGNYYGQLGMGDTENRATPTNIRISQYPPLNPRALIIVNASPAQVDLSWVDRSYNESGFKIERKLNKIGTYEQIGTAGANISVFLDSGPFVSGTYYYQVRAYNLYGNSTYSNEVYTSVWGNWLTAAAGSSHALGLKSDGTLWVWGLNSNGQLGIGTTRNKLSPMQAVTSSDWSLVAAGLNHSIAVKSNNTLWAWGSNFYGELGLGDSGTITQRLTPTQVITDSDWSKISGGDSYTVCIKTNNTIWSWGKNSQGQLGLGNSGSANARNTPAVIGSSSDWFNVACGASHTISLKTNGTLWSWGYNLAGQLGLGNTLRRMTPSQVTTESDWIIISAGSYYTIAGKTNNTLWSWGSNDEGQLGLGDSGADTERTTPTQIVNESDWNAIICGDYHSIGIKTNGSIWSWGKNDVGQLGLGDSGVLSKRVVPTRIGSTINWLSVMSSHGDHTISLKSNQTLWSWGKNNYGQLGLGDSSINRNTPTMIGE